MSVEYVSQTSEEAWQTVTRDIEYKIICGEYKTGERLPSIRVLTAQYRLSQWTIQKALEKLAKDGIVMIKRGTGYFVKPYIQSEIVGKHKKRLQKIIMDSLVYGEKIGLTEDELLAPYRKHSKQ